jgi:hypothetical protein
MATKPKRRGDFEKKMLRQNQRFSAALAGAS